MEDKVVSIILCKRFYSQLSNIFCNWLNAAPNPRCILPKNLALYSLANVHAKLSNG